MRYYKGIVMSRNSKLPIAMIAVFIWIGFVCSISFMEAWLKFRAVNMTLPIGLSIGRLIFGALNKVEWVLAFIILMHLILIRSRTALIYIAVPIVLLLAQTFLLLPALNERVDMVLLGNEVSRSFLHFYYLSMELIKVCCLFTFGVYTFKSYESNDFLVPLSR